MKAQASLSKAKWVSSWRSKRMRSFAKAGQPSVRALHHPAVASQPLAAVHTAPCNARLDAPLAQCPSALGIVIAFVRMNFVGALSRPALQARHRWYGVQQFFKEHRVVPVGAACQDRQRHAARIGQDVALAAKLAPVRGVGASFLAPRGLATLAPSMLARLQSIWSYWRSRQSSA